MKALNLRKMTGQPPSRSGFLLIQTLLACLAAVFMSAPTPAVAETHDDQVSLNGTFSEVSALSPAITDDNNDQALFQGTVSGSIPLDLGPPLPGTNGCVFSFTVPNSGDANQLGHFTGSANFVPNLCDGSYTGTFNWVAANGDRISGPFLGQLIPTATTGVFNNVETAVITAGTGRFRHATGMFNLYGQINFVTHTFVVPFQGTISRNN